MVTKDEFTEVIRTYVQGYIDNPGSFGTDPQIRVNPESLNTELVRDSDMLAEIGFSDEAVESAAAADDSAAADAGDNAVRQNPDFYAVRKLVRCGKPSKKAIEAVAGVYFRD